MLRINCEMSPEHFLEPEDIKQIVSSKDFKSGDWEKQTTLTGFPNGVNKVVLPIKYSGYDMTVVTTVESETRVPKHSHDETVFRYIIKGSLQINELYFSEGDWFLVPEGLPYEIYTKEGYTAITGYSEACDDQ